MNTRIMRSTRSRAGSLLAISLSLGVLPSCSRHPVAPAPAAASQPSPRVLAVPDTPATEANITRVTTGLLGEAQYAHRPFDEALAGALLGRYEDSVDTSRSVLFQSDVDDFAREQGHLVAATTDSGDTRVAHAIFRRYLERLAQQSAFMAETLRHGTFDFTGHDTYSYDREKAPRPRDVLAAQELWRQQLRAEYLEEKLGDKTPEQIVNTLIQRHDRQLRTLNGFSGDEVLDLYLDALAHVYDPHSDYLGREDRDSFAVTMNLSLVGIGAALGTEDGVCTIRDLVPGGPAARGGALKPGDRILAVAEEGKPPVEITNVPLGRAVGMIRGAKGTTVILSVLPAGAAVGSPPVKVSLVRDAIKLEDEEAQARIVDLKGPGGQTTRLGVIDLPGFYAAMGEQGGHGRSATADVARLLRKLETEHVRGIVLDVRKNGGGSLNEAISLTGLFIRKGPVVQTRDPSGQVEVDADRDAAVLYDGPLVVLTSRFSASATEIVAGALQDYGRALVVGDPSTFGKGTVQTILPLAEIMDKVGLVHAYDPGALKVTISKFYRPSGASTQLRGVAADLVLPSLTNVADVSESAMKNPLPWDTVPAAPHEVQDRVRPYLDALRQASARRLDEDRGLRELREDATRQESRLKKKTVSLNEAERRAELAETKRRDEARAEERRAAETQASRSLTYKVTLEDAAKPGLPPPVASTTPRSQAAIAAAATAEERAEIAERTSDDEATLTESERVLADYVRLLKNERGGVASSAPR